MTQTYAGVRNENMFSEPDFLQDSESNLRISIAALVQELFEEH